MMKSKFKTEQEAFWAGPFGAEYVERNRSQALLKNNLAFFSKIICRLISLHSAIEFGANIGLNLQALHILDPDLQLDAVEINSQAAQELAKLGFVTVHETSVLDYFGEKRFDLSFTKGVLIHINPEELPTVYDKLYQASARYILVAEYYNPTPMTIPYRGHDERLYKRDFAGELMQRYPDLDLVDYGFTYHNDPHFPQDDITWFLMEKKSA